jgi:tetratricopeptide (TPR) repeat protein
VVLLLAAMIGNPFSDRRDPLHPMLVALQAGVIAFLVHMSWDWDWDMAAVGTAAFVFIAVCVSYRATRRARERRLAREAAREASAAAVEADAPEGPPVPGRAAGPQAAVAAESRGAAALAEGDEAAPSRPGGAPPGQDTAAWAADDGDHAGGASRRRAHRWGSAGWAPRVLASVALLLLAASWLPPYLALRAENAALAASSEGDVQAALDHVARAGAWDPLAVSPLLTESALLQQLGRNRAALERLQVAAVLQPQNYEVWYKLGLLEHGAFGRDKAARAAFTRALALNPGHTASRDELERLLR